MKSLIIIIILLTFYCAKGQQNTFAGTYQLDNNPLRIFTVRTEKNAIYFCENNKSSLNLKLLGENKYQVDKVKPKVVIQFFPGKMVVNQGGKDYQCQKIFDEPDFPKAKRVPNRQNGFTRADTLRGKLSPLRDCYDVTYYHLTADIYPDSHSIKGNVLIEFNELGAFRNFR